MLNLLTLWENSELWYKYIFNLLLSYDFWQKHIHGGPHRTTSFHSTTPMIELTRTLCRWRPSHRQCHFSCPSLLLKSTLLPVPPMPQDLRAPFLAAWETTLIHSSADVPFAWRLHNYIFFPNAHIIVASMIHQTSLPDFGEATESNWCHILQKDWQQGENLSKLQVQPFFSESIAVDLSWIGRGLGNHLQLCRAA